MSRVSLRSASIRRGVLLLACLAALTSGVGTVAGDAGPTAVAAGALDRSVGDVADPTAEIIENETDELESGVDDVTNRTPSDPDGELADADDLEETETAEGELEVAENVSGDLETTGDRTVDGADGATLENQSLETSGQTPLGAVTGDLGVEASTHGRPIVTGHLGLAGASSLDLAFGNRSTVWLNIAASTPMKGAAQSDGPEPTDSTAADSEPDGNHQTARSATDSSIKAGLVGALGLSALTGASTAAGSGASAGAGSGASTTAAGSSATVGGLLSLLGQYGSALASLLTKKLPLSVLRYSRYDDSDPLEHETRRAIYESIEAQPGQNLSAIEAETDASLSTVRHHLDVLEAESLIVTEKQHGKRRLYPAGETRRELAAAMDEPARARVIETLAANGPITNGELAAQLERDPSTVSHHVAALADDGLLTRTRDGRTMVNALAPGVEAAYRERVENEPGVPPVEGPRPVGVEGAD